MKTIEYTKVKLYTSINTSVDTYIVTDGTNYIIDKDNGYVEYFDSKEKADNANITHYIFGKPFCEDRELNIIKIDNEYSIRDSNFDCLESSADIYSLLGVVDEEYIYKDDFPNFCFPKEETDNDYDGDYQTYDNPPAYYDPHYDGPYHYIPPGNH